MNKMLIALLALSSVLVSAVPGFADTTFEFGNFSFGGGGGGGEDYGGNSKLSKKKIRQMLGVYGLQPSDCLPNSVAILYGRKNKTVCAYPTDRFPGGYYSLHPATRKLSRIDGNDSQPQPGNVGIPGGVNPYPVNSGGYPQPYPVNPGGYPQPYPVVPGAQGTYPNAPGGFNATVINQPSSSPLPAVLGENGAPVPDNVGLHIRQIFAKRNIQLTSCSNSPITLFRVSQYTACAIGSPQYPAGKRFVVDTYLPF